MSEEFEKWLEAKKKENVFHYIVEQEDLYGFIDSVKSLLFPAYNTDCHNDLEEVMVEVKDSLVKLLRGIEQFENCVLDKNIPNHFMERLPYIDSLIQKDIMALYEGDPAAYSKTEIILCYPALTAIFLYRIAHILYKQGVPILPRVLSEYAHSKTGIDIHPGAEIGESFFIDHGTGIVIGETTVIGNHVKIYQGVTLGALSLKEGQQLKGVKRHPTIEDDVTIYAGASILGGNTVIGRNTTIGSNVFITESVEENMIVTIEGQKRRRKAE